MNKLHLVLAFHQHQPIGNFDSVFESAYQNAYAPFMEVVARHPSIRVNLHYSGALLDWLASRHPEFLKTVRGAVDRGQAEIVSGGYYEPILAILPEKDALGQIRKMSSAIEERFGTAPGGMWLAERVWEPHLARWIADAGIRYTFLDDTHFKAAGLREEELHGTYETQDQDRRIAVFPGSECLRYWIPFREPEESLSYLRDLHARGARLEVFADDGEKFGVWPGTHDLVYRRGWLDRFFVLLEENRDWLQTVRAADHLAQVKPLGTVFFPTCSYREMVEWTLRPDTARAYRSLLARLEGQLPADAYVPFVRAGTWRNFLSKYPESHRLYARMLDVSRKVHALEDPKSASGKRTRPEVLREALEHLWRGQCNDAYWHGIFGGLYLPHLRGAVYEEIIRAEQIGDRAVHGAAPSRSRKREAGWLDVSSPDIDLDGQDEIQIDTALMNVFLDPDRGGRLLEWDYKPASFHLTDTLSRRAEVYHDDLFKKATPDGQPGDVRSIHDLPRSKEADLGRFVHNDRYERCGLLDHFFGEGTTLDAVYRCAYPEDGDFLDGAYRAEIKRARDAVHVRLDRRGRVAGVPLYLEKNIRVATDSTAIDVNYRLVNEGEAAIDTRFGVEFNINLRAGNAHDRTYEIAGQFLAEKHLASMGECGPVRDVRMRDLWLGIEVGLEIEDPAILWRFPIETVSSSEEGFERVYQASCLIPSWRIVLEPGTSWTTRLRLLVQPAERGS